MKCCEIMTKDIEHCSLDEAVDEVARRMRDGNVSFLAVCDEVGTLMGALNERDLVVNVLAESRTARGTPVGSIMSNDLVCCAADDDVAVARDLMSRFGKSRVVCVDDAFRPVGVITGTDMLWAVLMPCRYSMRNAS